MPRRIYIQSLGCKAYVDKLDLRVVGGHGEVNPIIVELQVAHRERETRHVALKLVVLHGEERHQPVVAARREARAVRGDGHGAHRLPEVVDILDAVALLLVAVQVVNLPGATRAASVLLLALRGKCLFAKTHSWTSTAGVMPERRRQLARAAPDDLLP